MSEFNKKRGFMNINRMLYAPMFTPSQGVSQGINADKQSSTNMLGQEYSSNTQVIWGTNINQSEI